MRSRNLPSPDRADAVLGALYCRTPACWGFLPVPSRKFTAALAYRRKRELVG